MLQRTPKERAWYASTDNRLKIMIKVIYAVNRHETVEKTKSLLLLHDLLKLVQLCLSLCVMCFSSVCKSVLYVTVR